jgi:RND family efflux transporter MFP subunit
MGIEFIDNISLLYQRETCYTSHMASLMKKYWILLTIIVIAAIGGSIFYIRSVSASTSPTSKKKISEYVVTRKDLKETLTLSGEINAKEKAVLRFATSGKLAWVGVKEGDVVKKYQMLANLDQRELKKSLEKKLNSYMTTRWGFEQTKDDKSDTAQYGDTFKIRDAAKRIMDQSQFGLNNSVLDVELETLTMEYANLWTPIAGVVTRIDTPFAGINITPASAEFEVINPSTLYLSVLPDQTEVSKITSSMSAQIVFDSYPESTISGTITFISFAPKTGETSTVYEVKVDFPLDGHTYRLGMTADATFAINERYDVLAIPLLFLKSENGKSYVNKKVGNNKVKTPVEIGLESDDYVEITNGLSEGDILYD